MPVPVLPRESARHPVFNSVAFSGILAIGQINEALDEGDVQKTLAALQHPAAKLTDVCPPVAQHYFDKLLEARREKAHVRTAWKPHRALLPSHPTANAPMTDLIWPQS